MSMAEYSKYTDEELVELIRGSDNKASRELFDRHSRYIILCLKKYYKISQQKSEDICMETFSKIFSSIESYNGKWKFRTWAFIIARNLLIDQYRKENGKKKRSIGKKVDIENENLTIIDTSPSHEEQTHNKRNSEKIIETISSLPPLYRRAAELRFLHEYQYKSIAKELNLPLNTVKTRIRRAKLLLSNKLKNEKQRTDN